MPHDLELTTRIEATGKSISGVRTAYTARDVDAARRLLSCISGAQDAAERSGTATMTYAVRPVVCASCVNKPLTPKRRYRVVENDEYAAFLRRVINAYSRRVASGDVEAIADMAALAGHLEDATRQAITGLRAFGYSWADIAARLGITRQGAQQRWAEGTPATVTTPDGTRTNRSRP